MTQILTGIAVANGYGFGKAYKLIEPDLTVEAYKISNIQEELVRLHQALMYTGHEIREIYEQALHDQGKETAEIFHAHQLILQDPELLKAIETCIRKEQINAEHALDVELSKFIAAFEQLDHEYIKGRSMDIKDVRRRILAQLLNKPLPDVRLIKEPVVIVAKDIAPSDIAQMNQAFIKGLVTDKGGETSHATILAKMLGIPAVIQTKTATDDIQSGNDLIVDGVTGRVTIHPTDCITTTINQQKKMYEQQLNDRHALKSQPTITREGRHIKLTANIGSPRQVETALQHSAEGIGLYRTEFLYMEKSQFPTEEEQLAAYRKVLDAMAGKRVVIRTLDIGGDKTLDYWRLPNELNPSLGERAIRLSLNNQHVFRAQLRALLRASCYGNLSIMFPMITTIEELRQAKQLLDEEREMLVKASIPVSSHLPIGMMVETPAATVLVDQFASEVDFFSIGTNDLIQYVFAADRMNEAVDHLYQPYHPAILNMVGHVIAAAHRQGKSVSMCGEMASNPIAIPLLLGLGLDEFSMSPTDILRVRKDLHNLKDVAIEQLTQEALKQSTSEEVYQLVRHLL